MANNKLPKGIMSVALIMVVGALPPMFDSTIVNVAINSLAKVFSTDLDVMQWAVTGYVLALGIAVPFSGWLIKRLSGKQLFMGSLVLFLIGSLLSGLSWNIASLIIFRVVQGFAAGIMTPTLSTLAVQLAGKDNLGKLMSMVGIPVVFGPIIGPVIGGLILEYLPWHWLFFVNLPIGVIGLVLLQWKMPTFEARDKQAKLDWPGVLLLAVTSGTLVYGVTQVVKTDARSTGIVFLVIGAVAFLAYVIYALRGKQKALIPLSMFRSKNFSAAFISLFLTGFATNGPMLLFPMLFQNVRGLSVIMSALWLIPQGAGMLIMRPFIGRWTDRFGARWVVLPSLLITIIGTIPFVFFTATTSTWLVWAVLLVRGIGVGGFIVPIMADSYTGLPNSQVPVASVATRIVQNIGAAFGSAVLATVVTDVLTRHPLDLAGAYHVGFITSLAFMVIGVVPALFLTNKLKKPDLVTSVKQPEAVSS